MYGLCLYCLNISLSFTYIDVVGSWYWIDAFIEISPCFCVDAPDSKLSLLRAPALILLVIELDKGSGSSEESIKVLLLAASGA